MPLKRRTTYVAKAVVLASAVAAATANTCLQDASITQPVLIANCTSVCGYAGSDAGSDAGFCAYFPGETKSQCASVLDNRCVELDGCAYECYGRLPNNVWLYDSADSLQRAVFAMLFEFPTSGFLGVVNTKLVSSLHSAPIPFPIFELRGQPTRMPLLDFDGGSLAPTYPILDFKVPDSFFKDASTAEIIKLSAVPCPPFPEDVEMTMLSSLFLDNCGMSKLPWTKKQLPVLDSTLIVTDGAIDDIYVPEKLASLFLYNNRIKSLPKSLAVATGFDEIFLSHNPLGSIPKGSLPAKANLLRLKNCSLTEIPEDIATINATLLDISYNRIAGDKFKLDKLPSTLQSLDMAFTGQTSLPAGLKTLKLTELDFSGHKINAATLENLPPSLKSLRLRDCGLKRIPPAIATLTSLTTLDLRFNPIEAIDEGELPPSVSTLLLSGATFATTTQYALTGVGRAFQLSLLNISHSALESIEFLNLNINGGRFFLSNNAIATLPKVLIIAGNVVDLSYNRLSAFDASSLGSVDVLDLSFNQLETFQMSVTEKLQSLSLRGNKFTSVPRNALSLNGLRVLDLRDNPITGFNPSPQELQQLGRVALILMDKSQVAGGDCRALGPQFVCDASATASPPSSSDTTSSPSPAATSASQSAGSSATPTIVGGIIGATVVALAIALFVWHRRKKKTPSSAKGQQEEMVTTGSSGHAPLSSATSILDDDELLKHRLDVQSIAVQRVLASGAYGEVFLATYHGERVVLKRLKDQKSCSRQQIQQFASEIKLLATIAFPKIVPFIGVVWTKETDLGVVTAYMANGDLRSYLSRTRHEAADGWTATKLRIARDVAEALVYLHSLLPPLIHRDLKSLNVLLDERLNGCLSDFGSARPLPEDAAGSMTWGVGTALWMAPEVLYGGHYGTAADVFSMGVILSELDTHLLPYSKWSGDSERETSLVSGDVLAGKAPLQFLPSCPASVRELALRCVARDPADRPTAMVVAYSLRKLLRDQHGGFC